MKIEVTPEAVFVQEISPAERVEIEYCLRVSGGQSMILPRKPHVASRISEAEQLALLIECIRPSAQDTLAALRRRGIQLAREAPGPG
jgi:hypothetical protein